MSLEHWESYYRLGNLATSLMGGETGYTQQVRAAWIDFFGGCADGSRIVDLGCGNGAVLALAREAEEALGRRFELHGVDLARIDPVRHVPEGARRFAGVHFHPGTAAHAMPFPDDSVDALVGQYSLEFMDLSPVFAEMRRVLAPQGRAQFILHDAGSILVANARVSLRQAELILDDTRVLKLLRRYLQVEREAPAAASKALADLEAAAALLRREGAKVAQGSFLLETAHGGMAQIFDQRKRHSATANERAVDELELELRSSARRQRELLGAALDQNAMVEFAARLRGAGFASIAIEPQWHGDGQRVGWRAGWTLAAA